MCIFCDITGGLLVYGFTFSFIRSAFDPKHLCVVAEQSRKRSLSDSTSKKKPDLNLSDFPFEHLHWTMELKTAVRMPHVSNWLSCWGFSQRWANKSFLMKSAFLWIITGCALWINPRVSDCQSREEEPPELWLVSSCTSTQQIENTPTQSSSQTTQLFLLICLGFCNQWSHGKLWPNRSFCSCTTKRYLSVWVASIKGSYTLRLRFCLATLFLPFMKRFVVNVKDQQVMIWICLHSENELWLTARATAAPFSLYPIYIWKGKGRLL